MNSDTKATLFMADGHPDENQLFLALERELAPDEMADVERHLGSCWTCRARFDEMQRGILAFVEYREKRYSPNLPSAPGEFGGFPGQLRDAAGNESDGWIKSTARWITDRFHFSTQIRWASVVAATTAAIVLYVQVIHPPLVSAEVFLTRAAAVQNPPLARGKSKANRIARQRVEIRSGDRTVVRTFAWNIDSKAVPQTPWAPQADLLRWDVPFTVEAFAEWRQSLANRRDEVKRSDKLLTLHTYAADNWLKEASFSVRADDFHPVEEFLQFSDDRQLTVRELAFEIEEQSPAESSTVPQAGVDQKTAQNEPPRLPVPSTSPTSPIDLDEVELALRYTLYSNHWDLGEDLVIGTASGKVTLGGVVSSDEVARTMTAALGNLPNVELSISAPGAGVSPVRSRKRPSAESLSTLPSVPLLKEALDQAFTSRERRLNFVDECLQASDNAVSHAFALKGLADRDQDHPFHLSEPASRRKLQEMLTGHLEQIGRANSALDRLVKLLPAGSSASPAAIPEDQRSGIRELVVRVQGQDHTVTRLAAGVQGDKSTLADTAYDFRADHETINRLVTDLNHRIVDGVVK